MKGANVLLASHESAKIGCESLAVARKFSVIGIAHNVIDQVLAEMLLGSKGQPDGMRKRIVRVHKPLVAAAILFNVLFEFGQVLGLDIVAANLGRCGAPRRNELGRQVFVQRADLFILVMVPIGFTLVATLKMQW